VVFFCSGGGAKVLHGNYGAFRETKKDAGGKEGKSESTGLFGKYGTEKEIRSWPLSKKKKGGGGSAGREKETDAIEGKEGLPP